MHRSCKLRIYPDTRQLDRLARWEAALRFLWNLANEQRLLGQDRPRAERIYPTASDQGRELTMLRAELPWLADVPFNACSRLLAELDKSWQRCFRRLARRPRWKSTKSTPPSLSEQHPNVWRLRGATLHFPKLGPIRAVVHRPVVGTPRTCTLKRDGDQWFAVIVCDVEAAETTNRTEPTVAIDRGITNVVADSDGNLVPNPKFYAKTMARLARAQRIVSRRKKGSKNREKAKLRAMRLHRKVRRQREHFLHVLSSRYAKSHGVVVIEKLNTAGMIRSRLARSIADAGWSRFAEMLRYKLAWSGGTLLEVPAAYSSQTCSSCGAVDAASRKGERFCCTGCCHTDHADLNAAKVLLTRANRSGLPVEGTVPEAAQRSRKAPVRLRTPRTMLEKRRGVTHG